MLDMTEDEVAICELGHEKPVGYVACATLLVAG